ncbi:DinB family protein [Deinococcus hopiensis]|uniref:DinB superfamily protein n=1 Tax=Deinococcus hopiensis KR-140 TaxID=695939 RepID=A0A1W1V8L4_9DEIO|nr:DinB family protein [Deinococcus hopiensis]SMB89344.1 DinB superfamily protein [Deinococcus hopiensis KR-140]
MNAQTFLAEAFEQELGMFRTGLGSVLEETFAAPRLGHSPAWHALHIAEWLRFFALQDFSATYTHLGWENADWMTALRGTPPVSETDGKAAVLAELDRIGAQVVAHIRELQDDQLGDMLRAPAAPTGERARLTGLGMQLRHIAYHRGQLKLSLKDNA